MKEPNPRKSNVLRTIFISITLLLDGLSAAGLGYIYFIFMAILDPADFDLETKYANMRQGETAYVAGLIALLLFVLAAIFWWLGKRVGKYVATSLCIVGLLLSILILVLYSVFQLWPLLIFVLVLVGLNIFSLTFIFSKGRSTLPETE